MSENLPTKIGPSYADLAKTGDAAMDALSKSIPQKTFVSPVRLLQSQSISNLDRSDYPGIEITEGMFFFDGNILPKSGTKIVPLTVRTRAVRYENQKVVEETYDPNDPRFAEWFDSKERDKCAGPEFLLWLPDFEKFARYHLCGSAVNNMDDFQKPGRALHLRSHKITSKGNTWFVPRCSIVPGITPAEDWIAPNEEYSTRVIRAFLNPRVGENSEESIKDVASASVSDAPPPRAR